MAKTLVGFYDRFIDAERVVEDLIENGFARSDIRLAMDHAAGGAAHYSSVGWDSAYEGGNLFGTLVDLGVPDDEAHAYAEGMHRGGALVVVKSSDDRAERGMEILHRLHPVDIHERTTQWRQEGWTGYDANTTTSTATSTAAHGHQERERSEKRGEGEEEVTIPIVEEELAVGTRQVERSRVRISSHIAAQPVEQPILLREEKVTVERRAVNRPATAADLAAALEEVIEMIETVEEPVIHKRMRVVEEVVVHKDVHERAETVRSMVRRTNVDVEREPEERTETMGATATPGFAAHDAYFRKHYATALAGSSAAYVDYEPAYRYGYDLGTNERYHGLRWTALEAEAHRDWETHHPGTWVRFKDAIRYGWDKVRART